MFSVLVAPQGSEWETDQFMRSPRERFGEYSDEPTSKDLIPISQEKLKSLESTPALLMYERTASGSAPSKVRYGLIHDIQLTSRELLFRFNEKAHGDIAVINEFAIRLGLHSFEFNRTHWALKIGDVPRELLQRFDPTYDVVFSFAGENRGYVEAVAEILRTNGIRLFYDEYEQVHLWGKDLAEHLGKIYSRCGKYCVMFISKAYKEKMWTRHERRFAVSRALAERTEYILPVIIDDVLLPDIPTTTGYLPAPSEARLLAEHVRAKLGLSRA